MHSKRSPDACIVWFIRSREVMLQGATANERCSHRKARVWCGRGNSGRAIGYLTGFADAESRDYTGVAQM